MSIDAKKKVVYVIIMLQHCGLTHFTRSLISNIQ